MKRRKLIHAGGLTGDDVTAPKEQHTPTPWQWGWDGSQRHDQLVNAALGVQILEPRGEPGLYGENLEADMEFIIHAVNCHEWMLQCLRAVVSPAGCPRKTIRDVISVVERTL